MGGHKKRTKHKKIHKPMKIRDINYKIKSREIKEFFNFKRFVNNRLQNLK